MKHLGQFLRIAAFAAVCGVAGASAMHALEMSLWPGLVAGVGLGSLPAWLPRAVHGLEASRCAEWVGLAALIAIAGTLSITALLPALAGDDMRLETTLPLLLIAPALYVMYLFLNRSGLALREVSVADRLAGALSGPPLVLSLAMGVTLATCAVLLIRYAGLRVPAWEFVTARFTDRGIIPPLTLALFFWGLLLLANKTWVLWRERRMLGGAPGRSVLMRAREDALATDPGDTDDFLEMVWRKSADFYIVPRYINWAIPILGLHRHGAGHIAGRQRHPVRHRFGPEPRRPVERTGPSHRAARDRLRHDPDRAVAERVPDAPAGCPAALGGQRPGRLRELGEIDRRPPEVTDGHPRAG